MVELQTKTETENEFRYLSNDLVFKFIFGTNEHIDIVEDLLESFYELPKGTLKGLKVVNSVKLNIDNVKNKKFELDILVKLEDGTYTNLEFYNDYNRNSETKSMKYLNKIFATKGLKSGDDYNLSKRVTQINFTRNDTFHNSKYIKNEYVFTNTMDITDTMIPELLNTYLIVVDDKKKLLYNNINERLKLWLDLMNATSKEELEKLAKIDEMIERTIIEMKKFNEEEWIQDLTSWPRLEQSQHHSDIEEAEKKGENRGINIGLSQGKIEIAKSMLEETCEIPFIHKITGLPIKEINRLASELN